MKNITKLKVWPQLEKLGFIPVNFRTHGKVVCIGATNGKIDIQPHYFQYSNRSYHISGHSNKPITRKVYVYEYGHKQERYFTETFYSQFHKASELLTIINELNN